MTTKTTTDLQGFARQLHTWGASVTAIKRGTKHPVHEWKRWQDDRQTPAELNGLPWHSAAAVGIVNGSGDFRVFDIDAVKDADGRPVGSVSESVVVDLCRALGLPDDYQWSYRSGSGAGWGVVVRCTEALPDNWPATGVYIGAPRDGCAFGQLELRWSSVQTVIDGAHPTGPGYQWRQHKRPMVAPATRTADQVVTAFTAIAELEKPAVNGAISTQPPSPTPPPSVGGANGTAPTTGHASANDRYGEVALNDAIRQVSTTPPGNRNKALFKQTASLAELVNGGVLMRSNVEVAMTDAAMTAGLTADETRATIDSAFEKVGHKARTPAPSFSANGHNGASRQPNSDRLHGGQVDGNEAAGQPAAVPGTKGANSAGAMRQPAAADGNMSDDANNVLTAQPAGTDARSGAQPPPGGVLIPQPKRLAALLQQEFQPLTFLVEGILAKGHLAMLGGRPKSGKSWLSLQLAQAVDAGRPFLGQNTQRGKVLYVALEDGERRVYQRCQLLKWQPQDADVLFDIARFDGDGVAGLGVEQLAHMACSYDLVIVDTLIATLSGRANENDNVQMGQIVNALAQIAHSTDTAMLLIHHTGKGMAENVFDLLRGASALRGGYDVGMVLERKQGEREAVLHMESRDVDLSSMTIRQADNGAGWECLGNGDEIRRIRAGKAVVEAMRAHGDGVTVEQLVELTKTRPQTVSAQLKLAERDGLVQRRKDQHVGNKGRPADVWYLVGEGVSIYT